MEYGLIGSPLGHSLSPALHARLGGYLYELCELAPEALGEFLARRAFCGCNVTLPYKQAVLPYLDELDPQAAAIGAVNTIVNRGGRLIGYNTDFGGLRALLAHADVSPAGRKVLILGTGGTSKTASAAVKAAGAKELVFVSRTAKPGAVSYADAATCHSDAQIIVNTTPVGMTPDIDGAPIDLAPFSRLDALIDVVYTPLRTHLMQQAEALGIPAASGLSMLVRQAALSAELFTGRAIPEPEIETAFRELQRSQTNLVLIGMPGSGKTTVGRLLSDRLGREFLDCDEELVRQTGQSIPAIFAQRGEAEFRRLEAGLIRRLAAKQGCVIATGGGAVLDSENVRRLKQNGRLFLLDRPLSALVPGSDRPLASDKEALARLYAERNALYHACADEVIRIDGSAAGAAADIEKRF